MQGRHVAGLILVLLGLAFLVDAAGYADVGYLFGTYWPLILIAFGLVHLVTHRGQPLGGIILLGLGAWFLADELGYLPARALRYAWPLALVILGLFLILSRPRKEWPKHRGEGEIVREDALRRSVVFGGVDERVTSDHFKGGAIDVTFGGAKIDLRDVRLAPEGARLDLSATFGGIEIIVSPSWAVRLESRPFLGGVENKTVPPPAGPATATLDVRATATFGGVTIRN